MDKAIKKVKKGVDKGLALLMKKDKPRDKKMKEYSKMKKKGC